MAKTGIVVFNGAVSLPGNFNLDVQTMRLHENQSSENVTSYPAISGTPTNYGVNRGTGTPMQDVTVTGWPFKGAGAGTSNPFFGQMSLGNNANAATGAAATFQIDTGCTIAASYIVDDAVMDHSRIVAGAKTTLQLKNTTDITVTYAT